MQPSVSSTFAIKTYVSSSSLSFHLYLLCVRVKDEGGARGEKEGWRGEGRGGEQGDREGVSGEAERRCCCRLASLSISFLLFTIHSFPLFLTLCLFSHFLSPLLLFFFSIGLFARSTRSGVYHFLHIGHSRLWSPARWWSFYSNDVSWYVKEEKNKEEEKKRRERDEMRREGKKDKR